MARRGPCCGAPRFSGGQVLAGRFWQTASGSQIPATGFWQTASGSPVSATVPPAAVFVPPLSGSHRPMRRVCAGVRPGLTASAPLIAMGIAAYAQPVRCSIGWLQEPCATSTATAHGCPMWQDRCGKTAEPPWFAGNGCAADPTSGAHRYHRPEHGDAARLPVRVYRHGAKDLGRSAASRISAAAQPPRCGASRTQPRSALCGSRPLLHDRGLGGSDAGFRFHKGFRPARDHHNRAKFRSPQRIANRNLTPPPSGAHGDTVGDMKPNANIPLPKSGPGTP